MLGTTVARPSWARKITLAAALTGMCIAMVVPATASAGTDHIVNHTWVGPNGVSGPRHSLSSIWTTWEGGDNLACANALNANGTGWAGVSICAHPGDTTKNKNYCACQLRYGWGWGGDYAIAWIRQHW